MMHDAVAPFFQNHDLCAAELLSSHVFLLLLRSAPESPAPLSLVSSFFVLLSSVFFLLLSSIFALPQDGFTDPPHPWDAEALLRRLARCPVRFAVVRFRAAPHHHQARVGRTPYRGRKDALSWAPAFEARSVAHARRSHD
jgi:hypothetical protein